jgi:WbqC-like protein family
VKGRFEQQIKDVEIESDYFVRKHQRSIETSYRRAHFFHQYFPELASILKTSVAGTRLADLNIRLIQWLCGALGIGTPLLRSSVIDQEGCRSELLLKLCRALSADSYLSPLGSAEYLLDDVAQFSAAAIDVFFQHYKHPQYRQQFSPFCSHASALDLIFNEGDGALEILRSGRKTPLRPADIQLCEEEEVKGA